MIFQTDFIVVLAKIMAGFAFGYLIATWVESFAHQNVSDAKRKYVRIWERYPRLFRYFLRTYYSHHIVHHCKTFKQDYITQFRSQEEREKLDRELDLRGGHGRIIKQSNYAVKLHGSGALVFIAPLVPGIPLIWTTLGPQALAGAMLALMLPPLLSNFAHPYLHMPHSIAVETAPPWLAFLLRTRYFRAMARNHFLHHRYVAGNFNLLLGGDILRGVSRKPDGGDIAEMQRIGLRID